MTDFRTNQDIDDFVRGLETDTMGEPWDKQSYAYLRGIFLLSSEIAKRIKPDAIPSWHGPDGKPIMLDNGPLMPGQPLPGRSREFRRPPPRLGREDFQKMLRQQDDVVSPLAQRLPPIITSGNQIRMAMPLSRQNGPFWEDIGRLMQVLGYTYQVMRLEHEIRLTLTKEPL